MAYLDQAWLDAPVDPVAEAAAAAGLELAIGRIVLKAPDGEARFTAHVGGGAVRYEAGVDDSVDVTFTDTYENAKALLRGELDPNAAFMRGQTKVTGPTSRLLAVLAATTSDRYETARRSAAEAAGL